MSYTGHSLECLTPQCNLNYLNGGVILEQGQTCHILLEHFVLISYFNLLNFDTLEFSINHFSSLFPWLCLKNLKKQKKQQAKKKTKQTNDEQQNQSICPSTFDQTFGRHQGYFFFFFVDCWVVTVLMICSVLFGSCRLECFHRFVLKRSLG